MIPNQSRLDGSPLRGNQLPTRTFIEQAVDVVILPTHIHLTAVHRSVTLERAIEARFLRGSPAQTVSHALMSTPDQPETPCRLEHTCWRLNRRIGFGLPILEIVGVGGPHWLLPIVEQHIHARLGLYPQHRTLFKGLLDFRRRFCCCLGTTRRLRVEKP